VPYIKRLLDHIRGTAGTALHRLLALIEDIAQFAGQLLRAVLGAASGLVPQVLGAVANFLRAAVGEPVRPIAQGLAGLLEALSDKVLRRVCESSVRTLLAIRAQLSCSELAYAPHSCPCPWLRGSEPERHRRRRP
jgi:hypothetical protein